MTIKDEVISMMDYLGMDQFPQDGYDSHSDCAMYDGLFIDGYDGYQITLIFDKNEDTLEAHLSNFGRRGPRSLKFEPVPTFSSSSVTPRDANELFRLYITSGPDPDPMDIDLDSAEGVAILTSMHKCLMHSCRVKVTNEMLNQELDLLNLSWCKT